MGAKKREDQMLLGKANVTGRRANFIIIYEDKYRWNIIKLNETDVRNCYKNDKVTKMVFSKAWHLRIIFDKWLDSTRKKTHPILIPKYLKNSRKYPNDWVHNIIVH